ncbi:MAG: GGDEF domain-containing protein [Deltaproteobacteria bacterium]|nr:GGDEF domain-containing protein [Deltaproteobacteria bacterium]
MNLDCNRIEQWMTVDPVVMESSASLCSVISMMRKRRIGAILLVEDQMLAGIFTERDLLSLVDEFRDEALLRQPVSRFMTKRPITVNADESFNAVYMKMKVYNIRHLPVLKGSEIVGIVSQRDLAEFYEKKIESELAKNRAQVEQLRNFFDLTKCCEGRRIVDELERLEELSLTDFLTGLYNTRYFSARLAEELDRARRQQTHLSLIFCDIDYFKKVNDGYGHPFGDYVLREIGQLLVAKVENVKIIARLRKSDVVARYGGEEFVVILPETGKKNALEVAERMRQAIATNNFQAQGRRVSVTMSFGVAEFPGDSDDCDSLIKHADLAMYEAKKSGRNRVVGFAPKSGSYSDKRSLRMVASG